MLTLCVLGFLAEEPLHAYELRARISGLTGHVRPVSDGALYPALNRLRAAGLLTRREEPGSAGAPRQVLTLTETGRAELLRRLAEPGAVEITDNNAFATLLAFLHLLPEAEDQLRVLRRRLEYTEESASFFYEHGRPVRAEEVNRFRRGIFVRAGAARRAELQWLREITAELAGEIEARQG
ncbi:PadR family transcriptional regulator [Kitasatospora sp. RB6PN24]|uniref:PadR family transcriptional regulator n=1 Tax=Kitasatospora humi TaxID=2893891 RepID=UPI001E60A399|nr:PadR family transcriptional regulator [Kitasatospora humi]MCC9309066.1 PadR family transcriptional regulator [Kitasatospora humi]